MSGSFGRWHGSLLGELGYASPMKVLISGGAGYIGSTVANALRDLNHTPIVLDSLITGTQTFAQEHVFYQGDISDRDLLAQIFREHPDIHVTVHAAALVMVPESVAQPHAYYQENVCKSLAFFKHLSDLGYPRVVFSSSASIYAPVTGDDYRVDEGAPLQPTSPYARTKYMMEMVLRDLCHATPLQGIALRYFNPIGADPELRTGIHVREPSHVIGKLVDTALGKLDTFSITGVDWPTRDGSGLRDYIHVWDLALAHVRAAEAFDEVMEAEEPYTVINIGRGEGVTVKELVSAFEEVWGNPINKRETPPRPGDVAGAYASAARAEALLGWKAERSLQEGISSALAWGEKRKEVLGYP